MASPTTNDVHVDSVMTGISIAYRNPEYIADQIFPVVKVAKKSDLYFVFDKQSWMLDVTGVRGPGTEADLADYGLSTQSYDAITYAIAKDVPDEVRENADSPLQPEVEATRFVTDALLRSQERRVANMTTGGSALWAYSASPTVQWSSVTSDPWTDIDGLVNGVVSTIGQTPNVMVMSWDSWRYLRNHPDFLDRVKYTRPGGTLQPSDLANWFGFTKILVGTQLIDTAKEGATPSISYIWGDGVWAGYVPPRGSLMTPAAGYIFEWMPRRVERFRLDTRHSDRFEASHSVDECISGSDSGGVLFNVV